MPLIIIFLNRKRDDYISIQKIKRHLDSKAQTIEKIIDERLENG